MNNPWLSAFDENPDQAVYDMLMGRADFGMLQAEESEALVIDWLNAKSTIDDFPLKFDTALSNWIIKYWGKQIPAKSMLAVAWCRAAKIIEFDPALYLSYQALCKNVFDDRMFLENLTEGRSRDPLGCAWKALATYQKDRSLVSEWERLFSLSDNERWYRGQYGIYGLCYAPAADDATVNDRYYELYNAIETLREALKQRVNNHTLALAAARREFKTIVGIYTKNINEVL